MAKILKVKPQDQHLELEKRCYVPGYQVIDNCPKCGKENIWDGNEVYLSYPTLGQPESCHFCCCECEHEWQVQVVISLRLRLVSAPS